MGRGKPAQLTRYPAPLAAPHAPDLPPKGKKMGRVALQTAILPFSGALLFIGSCFGFVGNHDILSPNQPLNAAAQTLQYLMILGLPAVFWAVISLVIEVLLWAFGRRD
jgi:hypothetical protein